MWHYATVSYDGGNLKDQGYVCTSRPGNLELTDDKVDRFNYFELVGEGGKQRKSTKTN